MDDQMKKVLGELVKELQEFGLDKAVDDIGNILHEYVSATSVAIICKLQKISQMLSKSANDKVKQTWNATIEELQKSLSKLKLEDDPILKMSGLGKEIWEGVHPDEYVKELREDENDG